MEWIASCRKVASEYSGPPKSHMRQREIGIEIDRLLCLFYCGRGVVSDEMAKTHGVVGIGECCSIFLKR